MPRNGFFFLFMAPATTRAAKGGTKTAAGGEKTTDVRGCAAGSGRGPRVTRAPEAECEVRRSPAHLGFPGRKFRKRGSGDFRPRLGAEMRQAQERLLVAGRAGERAGPRRGPGATPSAANPRELETGWASPLAACSRCISKQTCLYRQDPWVLSPLSEPAQMPGTPQIQPSRHPALQNRPGPRAGPKTSESSCTPIQLCRTCVKLASTHAACAPVCRLLPQLSARRFLGPNSGTGPYTGPTHTPVLP